MSTEEIIEQIELERRGNRMSQHFRNIDLPAVIRFAEMYHQSKVKENELLHSVSVSPPKIHLVDVDGDIIESLNIMSNAEKLRDAINSDPESIAYHYQVMIRDER